MNLFWCQSSEKEAPKKTLLITFWLEWLKKSVLLLGSQYTEQILSFSTFLALEITKNFILAVCMGNGGCHASVHFVGK